MVAAASEEVAVLERTRLRLAGVADEQLEGVLARVLPNLLPLLKRPEADVRTACLAVLAHVNQRLRYLFTNNLEEHLPVFNFYNQQFNY